MGKTNKESLIIWIIMLMGAFFIFVFIEAPFYIKSSYVLTLISLGLLILAIGRRIPLRELTVFFTAIQYLLAPSFDYEFLGKYTYFHMRVPAEMYFGYVMPAFVAFSTALFFPLGRKLNPEAVLMSRIKEHPQQNRRVGMALVCIGLTFKYIPVFIGSIQALNFIFTLLSLLRFVGILYLWLSDSKYKKWIVGAVLVEFIASVFSEAIFIHLIILLMFLYAYYALINKPNKLKIVLLGLLAGVLLFVLQSIKNEYRKSVWSPNGSVNRIALLSDLFSKRYLGDSKKSTFLYTVAAVNLRLNQGWVMDIIMRNLPHKRPFFDGELFWNEFYGLVLPRFLASDKAVVQSSEKFERFAGYKLINYTIAVGIFGDGYGNFGVSGGIFFTFCVGLFFNFALRVFYRMANKNPALLLWSIFVFFYLIRAGDDFYIITNWIIKSSLMLVIIFQLFKKSLIEPYRQRPKAALPAQPSILALN